MTVVAWELHDVEASPGIGSATSDSGLDGSAQSGVHHGARERPTTDVLPVMSRPSHDRRAPSVETGGVPGEGTGEGGHHSERAG